jgi:hypothetical protein
MELNFTVTGEQAAELVQMPKRELFLFWNEPAAMMAALRLRRRPE